MRIIQKPLEFTNSGNLELFFIGSGSAFTKKLYQTNLLIIKGDEHLLIDCGTKCSQAFFELGKKVSDVKNLLITHSHADHIGGLEEVALMGRYFNRRKANVIINETYQHLLWDMSLRGGCAFNEEEAGDTLNFNDFFNALRPEYLTCYPRETFEYTLNGINIKMFRTKHIPDTSFDWASSFWSCGVIIDEKVMFTSDTRFDPELIIDFEKKFNFEIIIHDCQFFTGGVHASIDELATLPAEIKKKMYLVHYGDNYIDFVPKMKELGFADFIKQHTYYSFD